MDVDTVLSLGPGSYRLESGANVESQGLPGGAPRSHWEFRLQTPPRVPVARGSRAGLAALLLVGGLVALRRRA